MDKLQKIMFYLFAILLFFVPLILWPFTSEVFEFNKMVLTYVLTTLVVGVWAVKCVLERKFIFRRTILDVPLLVFLGSQLISTLLSIDPQTSWLGYYSRFNGGFLSTICYSLLYWAFVSNFDAKHTLKLINYSLLPGALLVSIYGVLEHFGIDKNIWVQDVQSRVFSTLGQPNWLAAWLVALMPVTWALAISKIKSQNSNLYLKSKNFWIYFPLSILFFSTLIFTKSRSGLLGFVVAFIIFWGFYFWLHRQEYRKALGPFTILISSFLIIALISGTQFSPSLIEIIKGPVQHHLSTESGEGPALETGGTESGIIRKIVWTGALQVWLHYPVFGSGVETFAYSYYKYRPAAHNLVSEWDFIYNKAHNEFLNVAANTGTTGLLSYLILIGFSIFIFIQKLEISNLKSQISNKFTHYQIKNSLEIGNWKLVILALASGYASLLATNFFGFSVVPTQLEFFLFPALAVGLTESRIMNQELRIEKITQKQKVGVLITLILTSYFVIQISRYWYADTLYNKGKAYNGVQKPDIATKYLIPAVNLQPGQAIYHSELANSYTAFAAYYYQQKDAGNYKKFSDMAVSESDKAISLSPANVNLKRARFGVFIMLSPTNPNYLLNARDTLVDAIKYAPTDAKLFYNLGLVYARTGEPDKAIETFQKTIELKANYKEARLAYALMLIDKKRASEAKNQLEYILKNLDPNDSLTKQTLEGIK